MAPVFMLFVFLFQCCTFGCYIVTIYYAGILCVYVVYVTVVCFICAVYIPTVVII